jgi:hypothetical protein
MPALYFYILSSLCKFIILDVKKESEEEGNGNNK